MKYFVRIKDGTAITEIQTRMAPYYTGGAIVPKSLGHILDLDYGQKLVLEQMDIVAEVQLDTNLEEIDIDIEPITFTTNYVKRATQGSWTDTNATTIPNNVSGTECRNWGLLHCTSESAPNKQNWGLELNGSIDDPTYSIFENYETSIFNQGEHVDVVITDAAIPFDHPEWGDGGGGSRFQQFDWHTLTPYVQNELGFGGGVLTGSYGYINNTDFNAAVKAANERPGNDRISEGSSSHGLHVGTIAAGLWNGWAKKANVYSINLFYEDVYDSFGQSIIGFEAVFFYLRAFHRTKAINPATGRKNPTIVNCSWGGGFNLPWGFDEWESVTVGTTLYNPSNPFPITNTWDVNAMIWETGMLPFGWSSYNAARRGYVQDCANDGIVLVAAAGNDNQMLVNEEDVRWNSVARISGTDIPIYKSQWEGAITVGALSANQNKNRASFSNFGQAIDIWAPGEQILASVGYQTTSQWGEGDNEYGINGWIDSKYSNDVYINFSNGTSMASPQVCGAIACHAGSTTSTRYTAQDARGYLDITSQTNWTSEFVDAWYYDDQFYEPNPTQEPNRAILFTIFPRYVDFSSFNAPGSWAFQPSRGANHPFFFQDTNGNDPVSGSVYELYETSSLLLQDALPGGLTYRNFPYMIKTAQTIGNDDEYPRWGRSYFTVGFDPSFNEIYGGAEPRNSYHTFERQDPLGKNYYFQSTTQLDMTLQIQYKDLPSNILNYKFTNPTYLDDSTVKSLICKTTRHSEGMMYQPEGQRTHEIRYPRNSVCYR